MPRNKSQTIKEKERKASIRSESITLGAEKAKEYPPSLNNIPKNEEV
jgi:hypothetical protein